MKFEEILPALRAGKKVRRKAWPTDTYTMHPYDWEGRCMTFCESDVFQDDWEPFEDLQYMNFLEAVKVAKEKGKTVLARGKATLYYRFTPEHATEILGDWYVE
jgi:hypothetical protein